MSIILVVFILLFLSFIAVYMVHIVKVKFPRHYFSLGQILIDDNDDVTILGFLTKIAPPFLICLVVGFVNRSTGFEMSLLVGFFSSFLVIRPVILCRGELLSQPVIRRIRLLFLIYIFYICTYLVLSFFGFFLGSLLRGVDISRISNLIDAWYTARTRILQDTVVALIVTSIVGVIFVILKRTIVSLAKRLREKILADEQTLYDEK